MTKKIHFIYLIFYINIIKKVEKKFDIIIYEILVQLKFNKLYCIGWCIGRLQKKMYCFFWIPLRIEPKKSKETEKS